MHNGLNRKQLAKTVNLASMVIFLSLSFVATANGADNDKKMAQEYLNKGSHFIATKLYRPALSYLERAAKLDPKNAEIQFLWGMAYFKLDEKKTAIEHFKTCLLLDPKFADQECYRELGQAYVIEDLPEEGIAAFTRGLKVAPRSHSLLCERGCTYALINQNDKAIADLSQAIRIFPNQAHYLRERALIYKSMHQYDNSLKDLTAVINLLPENARAYADRGSLLKLMGKADLAAKDFQKSMDYGVSESDSSKYKR